MGYADESVVTLEVSRVLWPHVELVRHELIVILKSFARGGNVV